MQSLLVQICNSGNYHTWQIYEIMVDNVKLLCESQDTISRLLLLSNFKPLKKGKYYDYLVHKSYGNKFRLQFRKIIKIAEFSRYKHVEIVFAPHYHYNNYKHNGNDFSPINCIKAIQEILDELEFLKSEYADLKVVNIEFGFNLIVNVFYGLIIEGLLFHKKTNFYRKFKYIQHYLITNTTAHKQIKVYAKGLQCHEKLNAFEVDKNTLRIEVKSKQSKYINKLDIYTAKDLLNLCKYDRLMNEVLKEWDSILLLNLNPDFGNMKKDEVEFIQNANTQSYWEDLLAENANRNKFGRHKAKYHKILKGKNNLHQQIKNKIIEKIEQFKSLPISTVEAEKIVDVTDFIHQTKPAQMINLEYAPPNKITNIEKGAKVAHCTPCFLTHPRFARDKGGCRSP